MFMHTPTILKANYGLNPKEVCNGGVACSLLAADKPRPLLQNSLVKKSYTYTRSATFF